MQADCQSLFLDQGRVEGVAGKQERSQGGEACKPKITYCYISKLNKVFFLNLEDLTESSRILNSVNVSIHLYR